MLDFMDARNIVVVNARYTTLDEFHNWTFLQENIASNSAILEREKLKCFT